MKKVNNISLQLQFLKVYNLQLNISNNFKILITLIIVYSFLRYEISAAERTISPQEKKAPSNTATENV